MFSTACFLHLNRIPGLTCEGAPRNLRNSWKLLLGLIRVTNIYNENVLFHTFANSWIFKWRINESKESNTKNTQGSLSSFFSLLHRRKEEVPCCKPSEEQHKRGLWEVCKIHLHKAHSVDMCLNSQVQIHIDRVGTERVHEHKFLGIITEDKISWKSHMKQSITKYFNI